MALQDTGRPLSGKVFNFGPSEYVALFEPALVDHEPDLFLASKCVPLVLIHNDKRYYPEMRAP